MLDPMSILRIQQLYGAPQAISGQNDPSQVLNNPNPYEQMGPYFNQQSQSNSVQPQPPAPSQGLDVQQRLRQLYNPQHSASDELGSYLQNMPKRTEPGNLTKIAGMLAGLGTSSPLGIENGQPIGFRSDPMKAFQVQEAIKDEPYNQKLQDWELGIKPREFGANQERERNSNERLVAEQTLQKEINQQKADEMERANKEREAAIEEKNNIAKQRADIAQQRADVYKNVARGGTIQTDKDGKSWMVYKDGTKEELDLQKFTPAEIQELKTHSALVLEAARAADAAKLESQKQGGRAANIEASGQIRKDVKSIAPTPKSDIQKTEEIYNAKGESQGKKVTTTGKPQTKIKMRGPDNNVYMVPADKEQDAIKNGMKRAE